MLNTTTAQCDRLWTNARLATMEAGPSPGYGVRQGHAIGVRDGKIAVIAPMERLADGQGAGEIIDCRGGWVTPGFVDCHTHLVYGGNRTREIEKRWSGASYEQVAREGGGILATVAATRLMSEAELLAASLPRLQSLLAEGVTTVEIKSGYGLTLRDELKMLRVARRMAEQLPVNVSTTLLAAHALPPEFAGRADDYVVEICEEMIPAVVREGLADAVDAFCDSIAFAPSQCERIFDAATRCGLPVKGHFEQLADVGGAHLAARFKALSADHLEHLGAAGVRAIAAA
ncbi:MAG: imidazolonepropionase, partial [Planctomycetaceae bacterium]|nr:imidazolonepropionase [Planctomycetaceae bacterium]